MSEFSGEEIRTRLTRFAARWGAAEHAFDLWPSERAARIAEGIGRFLTAIARESDIAGRRTVPSRPGAVTNQQ